MYIKNKKQRGKVSNTLGHSCGISTQLYLQHHGVPGQKWGVRRYQNYDGTLTSAGRKRKGFQYVSDEFKSKEQDVLNNMSNKVSKFSKQPLDIDSVMDRSGLGYKDATVCSKLAMEKYNEASKLEPGITRDVVSCVSKVRCKMYGLDYRLKQPSSLAGKIGADSVSDGISFKVAQNGIKDAVRYTAISDSKYFVRNYFAIKNNLETLGYKQTKCKNYFEMYSEGKSMHKAVQCNFKDPNGYTFELQFQTPASQAAKELKIPIYEERRKTGITQRRASELEIKMRDLAEQVEDPPGIEKIK